MKQLLTLLFIAVFACSCNVTKKSTKETHATTDSTVTKSATVAQVKKTDSTGTVKTETAQTKKGESGYTKKTTVVREYFTDEFGEDRETPKDPNDYFLHDTTKRKSDTRKTDVKPAVKMRETSVTEEEGFNNTAEQNAQSTETTSAKRSSDSLAAANNEAASKQTTEDTESTSKFNWKFIPWWAWVLLLIVASAGIYFKSAHKS